MRVGDIYFRQMDKPDRDYSKTVSAEQEYRLMLQQFPESSLVPQANQRLREVQETLASREANTASSSAQPTPPDWPAAIARYQTVVDTYPLYSHLDDVLVGLGDAYEAEARYVRSLKAPPAAPKAQQEQLEAGKARLEKLYDGEAADAYRKVILEHSAAAHVEDARDRLVGMGLPVPTPTPEQVAASTALENSRGQYTLSKRAIILFLNKSDTVPAATTGAPPLEDPTPTSAAKVVRQVITDFNTSMSGGATPQPAAAANPPDSAATAGATPPAPAASNAPLSLQEVPAAGSNGSAAAITSGASSSPSAPSSVNTMGIEIIRPGPEGSGPITAPATPPAFPGTTAGTPAQPRDETGGIGPVGPKNAAPLPPIEKPAVAPEAVNDAATRSEERRVGEECRS